MPDSDEAGAATEDRLTDPAGKAGNASMCGNALACVWLFIAFPLAIGAWSIASPLMSGPDEPGHVNQAAAIVRGQIDEPEQPLTRLIHSSLDLWPW